MAGTREGVLKAVKTVKERDPDFYRRIGQIGGRKGHTGGFASNPELARIAGAKGGRISRRRPKVNVLAPDDNKTHICVIKVGE